MNNVLVTCPPMLGQIDSLRDYAKSKGIELHAQNVVQTLSEEELIEKVPLYEGWIIGDDPASRKVFEAAKKGKLKAALKWGIGVDNVNFDACRDLNIPFTNTPNMFGGEVADVAVGYLMGLARDLFSIDRDIRAKLSWPKPAGISVSGKSVGVVGFGDIGYQLAKRLIGFDVNIVAYDPGVEGSRALESVVRKTWGDGLDTLDFLIFTCSLNKHNYHMLDTDSISKLKRGCYVINVARGPLIDEEALLAALRSGHIAAAALDVFEREPLPESSELRSFPKCIFGSHNGSNTVEAVKRASIEAINKLADFLNEKN